MNFEKFKSKVKDFELIGWGISLMIILFPTIYMLGVNWLMALIFAFALMWGIFMIVLAFRIESMVEFYCLIFAICIIAVGVSAITSNIYKDKIELEKSKVRDEIAINARSYIDDLLTDRINELKKEGYEQAYKEAYEKIEQSCMALESEMENAVEKAYKEGYSSGWRDKINDYEYYDEGCCSWEYINISPSNWEDVLLKDLEKNKKYGFSIVEKCNTNEEILDW